MKKQEVLVASLLRPTSRRIRIRCSNQRRWKGITLSNDRHAIYRLGKDSFAGLACDSVLGKIFPNGDDVIRVELTENGALIQAEGMPRILSAHAENSNASILAPYHRRTHIALGSFTLKIESA